MQETWVRSLGQEYPLEKEMATHSSTSAQKIPWMEEPSRLQSVGSQRVRHDWVTSLSLSSLEWSSMNAEILSLIFSLISPEVNTDFHAIRTTHLVLHIPLVSSTHLVFHIPLVSSTSIRIPSATSVTSNSICPNPSISFHFCYHHAVQVTTTSTWTHWLTVSTPLLHSTFSTWKSEYIISKFKSDGVTRLLLKLFKLFLYQVR